MKTLQGIMCDKCHDLITEKEEKQGDALHYGKVDYHVSCYVDYLRSKGAIPKQERKAS